MRSSKYTFVGFILFFITITFNVAIGIYVYSLIVDKDHWVIALLILLLIIVSSIICCIIDLFRRKLMIEKPLKEILRATDFLAKGNFKIRLNTYHSYENYDEFDYIKADINKVAKELSKSEVLKNDFIANVSHEIKTPLSVIQSYAKALKNNNIDESTKQKYLDNLQNACDKLNNLVSNILKLNKLENQKILPELKKFNLSECLTNQILQYEELIEKKEINLECEITEDLYINSEESYLELIFNNLISNAIKFTENKGTIKVSLCKENVNYIVKVSDTGCGIDKETGLHIFDKFYQGETSHFKEGNGLGLALVKKVIDILGGSISVESELNVGTTFIVKIKEN